MFFFHFKNWCMGVFFLILICLIEINAQTHEQKLDLGTGIPQITYYSTDDYHAYSQNWAIVQDSAGIMYFGNGWGILTYDGRSWSLITLPNKTTVFALAIDKNNRIYVGAEGEIGYLESDQKGRLHYVSLLPYLKEEDKSFSESRVVYCTSKGVYFQTNEELLLWNGKQFKIWKAGKNRFVWALGLKDDLILNVSNNGLMHLVNNKLELIKSGEKFNYVDVFAMLPYDETHLLLATKKNGLFLYDGSNIFQFKTDNDQYLKENHIYCGILLTDSSYALGTLQGGIVVINKNGSSCQTINKENELISLGIKSLFQDRSGLLWAALDDGIAKIEYPSPFSRFVIRSQSKENVQQIIKFHNKIYAGTDRGLYYMEKENFHLVKGAKQKVWFLLNIDNSLLVALERGLYQVNDEKETLLQINNLPILGLTRSKIDINRVFIGHELGLSSVYYRNGKWHNEKNIPGIYGSVHDVIEMPNGDLWLETIVSWVWKISFQNKKNAAHLQQPLIKKYSKEKGLPDDLGQLYLFENHLIFSSEFHSNNLYRYHESVDTFLIDKTFNKITNLRTKDYHLALIDNDGNAWFDVKRGEKVKTKIAVWNLGSGNYHAEDLKESSIIKNIGIGLFYDSANHFILYGGKGEILKHDLSIKEKPDSNFNAHIGKVIFNDSILYGGNRSLSDKKFEPSLPFYNNKFDFQFSSLSYHDEKVNLYQYYLEGFDKNWSDWSEETQREYTNLSEGSYIFHIRAKNIFGYLSNEDKYAFIILPPWYRSWWVYLFYIFAGLGVVGLIVQWRSRHLKHEKEELEKVVEERTNQLAAQANQLADQAEQLKEVDKQKARFFANISHEFRTPLTLIKGPIEQALETPDEFISKEDKLMIRNNADRLLKLVNQLLDLSKLDANNLELNPIQGDVFGFLRAIGSAFSSYAEQRNIKYFINIPDAELYTLFDQDKLEKIIYNLLSNAFKFTNDNGEISINTHFNDHLLTIEIADNGKGITPEHLPFIFDRFFQSDNSTTREYEGTGIGLSLTKELVALMSGKINVESQPGKGSKFTLEFPIEEISGNKDETVGKDFKSHPLFIEDSITTELNIEKGSSEKPIILIVEDNSDMRWFIRKQLINNYNTFEASHGEEGLKIAKKEIPDLVITDLMMPKMDGMVFCEKLKNDEYTNHIPVIMLTAKAGQENKIEGLEIGADDYLTKPFDRNELRVRINNLIHQRQELRKKFSREIILQPRNINISSIDEQFLKKVENLIEENISDENFGVPELQNGLAMSKTQLHRKMKAVTDKAPGEFLRHYRLERAAQLLKSKGGNITEIAYSVGFGSLSYFTRSFKELYHLSPSEYSSQNPKPDKV